MTTTEQRFHDKYIPVTETGCWLWTAYTGSTGYGQLRVRGRKVKAHRFAWELANGPIPTGLHVCHKCDTPSCVNPDHLFLGTIADNMADRDAKGRASRGSKQPNSKLNEARAVEIFLAAGPQTAIAARYGINQSQVSQIKHRKSWTHATMEMTS